MKQFLSLCFFLCIFTNLGTAQGHFLVELEERTPDVQTMVRSYEGMPAIAIMANDIDGVEQFIGDYKGETLILWFWHMGCATCIDKLAMLNELSATLEGFNILSFADDSKADLLTFRESTPINFPIIPNSAILSDGPYGGDLGTPKLFFVDKAGIIKWVFPASEINRGIDLKKILTILHEQKQ